MFRFLIIIKMECLELRHDKTCLQGFLPGPTQTGLQPQKMVRSEILDLGSRDCTICIAKIKALICAFVFACAKIRFSQDMAKLLLRMDN